MKLGRRVVRLPDPYLQQLRICVFWATAQGGGDFAYERVGMLIRNFELSPLKETNNGMAQDFLTPKRDHIQNILPGNTGMYFYNFLCETLNNTFMAT